MIMVERVPFGTAVDLGGASPSLGTNIAGQRNGYSLGS